MGVPSKDVTVSCDITASFPIHRVLSRLTLVHRKHDAIRRSTVIWAIYHTARPLLRAPTSQNSPSRDCLETPGDSDAWPLERPKRSRLELSGLRTLVNF